MPVNYDIIDNEVKTMNIPNRLTVLRVLLIPFMVILYYLDKAFGDPLVLNGYSIAIGSLFIVASLTDFLDGFLARRWQIITVFGKFLDPLADKLLVMFALLMLQDIGVIPMWIVLVILTREFIVTGIRLIAVDGGNVIAASNLGKYKTASTMVALILLLFHVPALNLTVVTMDFGLIILYIATVLTIVSGLEYIIKNQHTFKDSSK